MMALTEESSPNLRIWVSILSASMMTPSMSMTPIWLPPSLRDPEVSETDLHGDPHHEGHEQADGCDGASNDGDVKPGGTRRAEADSRRETGQPERRGLAHRDKVCLP